MVETQEDSVDTQSEGMNICCPICKSKDIILREDKEGYFWIYLCNNCSYQGKEGDKIGCLKDNHVSHHFREE